jgi:hypothetical protein
MEPFGILVKSYRGDFDTAQRLFESIRIHNVERIPVWVVVPEEDKELFKVATEGIGQVISESDFAEHLVSSEVAGIRPGYINQEIIKISFWELELAENYLPVDSDAVFLRPFGLNDFMHSADVPYTVLLEDRDLQMDPDYFATHWQGRERALRKIQREVGLEDSRLLTCHGHQVLSSTALRSLKEEFLVPRGWTYAEMLARGPYEFSWYNFWLQKSRVIPIEIREPYFKVLHSEQQHAELVIRGVTMEDVARGYVGVIVNSNFARAWGDISYITSRSEALSRYLTWQTLGAVAATKLRSALRRER